VTALVNARRSRLMAAMVVAAAVVSGCGPGSPLALGGREPDPATRQPTRTSGAESVAVNRYLWNASLDVLSFLPVESADPFTGVIVTGYGVPPGGSVAYRATVYVSDPALDARALNVALFTQSGRPVAAETAAAVEDAILTRARQLRIRDRGL
jgi:hypothetical protein